MDAEQNLWTLIVQGGWAMYPLGACCVFLIFLIIYVWRETMTKKFLPLNLIPSVKLMIEEGQFDAIKQSLIENDTVFSRVIKTALNRCKYSIKDVRKKKIEETFTEALDIEENNIAQWVQYLNVVAAIAPMIGLLGTVSGMISAFQTISLGGMGRPELLAGDIGEALITTATGLVIGIPAMIFFFILRNRLNNQMLTTTQAISDLIDDIKVKHD